MRHAARDRDHILRARAPGDERRQIAGIDADLLVEMRALVGMQRIPIAPRLFPGGALRRARPAHEIGEGLFVGRDHAGARAAFDRHVADGHPAFHRKRADRFAGEFDDIAGAAGRADLADDGEHDVLRGHAVLELALDIDPHVLGFFLDQRLGREHMLDFRRADAMRQRAEGAMRRGMAVAADDGRARQRETLLRADDVDDALAHIHRVEIVDAEITRIGR